MSDAQRSTLPAVVTPADQSLPSLDITDPGMRIATSLDLAVKSGKRDLMVSQSDAVQGAEMWINKVLNVRDYLAQINSTVDEETGECVVFRSFVLFQTDGPPVRLASNVAWRDLCIIASCEGPMPWPDGRRLLLTRVPSRPPRSMLRLTLQTDASGDASPAKQAKKA